MRNALTIAALLAASTAWADKQPKRAEVRVEVELSERVKPLQKPTASPRTKPAPAETIMAIELLTTPFRAEQEAILKKLIATTPESAADEKADYYFLLGELYAKQQRMYRLQAGEAEIKGDKRAAAASAEKSRQYMIEAVRTYRDLTDNDAFRNYTKMDLALFVYAWTLQSGKYFKEARAVYDKLLKNYPSSKYVPEAHFAFADYYFESGQLADAEGRYKMVLKFPRASVYWHAMYKLGWIQLNLAKHQQALEMFFQVANATKNDAKQEVLNRAAKKDFVRAYSEVGKTDKAFDMFKHVDQKSAFGMLETLADFYLEQGKSDRAIYTLRELMRLAPKDKNVCLWQYNVAHAMLSAPGVSTDDKIAEIVNLNRMYGAVQRTKQLPVVELGECRDNAAAMSGELARAYHSEWAKTKSLDSFAAAEKLYTIYLATFASADDFAKTRYYHAELLWSRAEAETEPRRKTQLWENAALAFTDVVKGGRLEPALLKESAYAAVSAFLASHEADPRVPAPAKAGEIPERDRKMLAAFDLYLGYVKDPKDDDLVRMKVMKANVLRRYGHYDEAIPLFKDVLARNRDHELAEDVANLLLDTYNQKHDELALVALADQLLADTKFLDDKPTLKTTAEKIQITALRIRAERIEKEARATKNFAKLVACGNAYLDIYNRRPLADDNDEILYNAGVCFQDGRSIGLAVNMYSMLERLYPKSPHTAKAVMRAGKAFGDIARYDLAAEKLEQYAHKYAAEKDAHDAVNDAVLYRKGNGDDAKAIEDVKYYVRMFGARNPAKAANAAFSLTSIYEKQGNDEAVIAHLRDYIRVHGSKGGVDKLVVANAKIGQILFKQSCPAKEVDGACVKITRERAIATKVTRRRRGGEQPRQCGPESKINLVVVARDPRKLRDALAAFAAAGKEAARVKAGADDTGGVRYYAALGKFAEANVEFEKYLTLAFPTNLDFDKAKPALRNRSLERFNVWMAQKEKLGASAVQKFEAVRTFKDAATSIAAVARLGQITQNFSDALFTAEIPKDVRTGEFADEKVEAYCDVLTERAEPLAARSLEAYGVCLAKSTELGWFSEWSRLCERELGQIKPEQYPTASERRGESDRVAAVMAVEPAAQLE